MKYISIDIETSGLDVMKDQVLEIGAIIEDSNNPLSFEDSKKFHCIIYHDVIHGNPFALNLNANLLVLMAKRQKAQNKDKFDDEHDMVPDEETAVLKFANWVRANYDAPFVKEKPYLVVPAGKNFSSFDRMFLQRLPGWEEYIRFMQRVLDPGVLYVDWQKDFRPPGLAKCKDRAGLDNKIVSHNAIEDAWDVIQILRTKYKENK